MKSLEQLLAEWKAGTLSTEELAELKSRLASDQGRSELVAEWLLDEAIYDTLRSQAAEAPAHAGQPAVEARQKQIRKPRRSLRWFAWHELSLSLRWPLGFALTCFVLWLGIGAYFQNAKVGSLTEVRGAVAIHRDGKKLTAIQGQTIYPGDRLSVPAAGSAVMAWDDEPTRFVVSAGTDLEVRNPMLGKRISLQKGFIDATVASQMKWRPMIISTPQAQAKVVGTQFWLSATGALTRLSVLEGAVLLRKTHPNSTDTRKEVMVHAGEVANAAPGAKLETQFLTGLLSSDLWMVPPGTPLKSAPQQGNLVRPTPEILSNKTARFVERLRGYLIAPTTGNFTFWIAPFSANAPAELWFSSDESPDHKRLIAFSRQAGNTPATTPTSESNPDRSKTFGAALSADWGRSPNQKSNPQTLVQGRRYYLEVWHEGPDVRSLALGWLLPGQPANTQPGMVDLQSLCPFFESIASDSRNVSQQKIQP